MHKAVIFDMDGVIFDSESLYIKYSIKSAKEMGYDMPYEFGLSLVGVGKTEIKQKFFDKYGEDFPLLTFQKKVYSKYEKEVINKELSMKKGVVELLEFLKNNNFKIGLASSTELDLVLWQLKIYDIYKYFDYIIGGDDVCKTKPCPECYLLCMKNLEVNSNNTYVIEDSFDGVKAGFKAKTKVLMVPDLLIPNKEISSMCQLVASDLLEVKKYLEKQI